MFVTKRYKLGRSKESLRLVVPSPFKLSQVLFVQPNLTHEKSLTYKGGNSEEVIQRVILSRQTCRMCKREKKEIAKRQKRSEEI